MKLESWVLDVVLWVFFLLTLREGRLILGKERTSIFLWGSILWTGIIENVMVVLGGYDYFAYAGYYSFGGRTIEGYGGWFSWALYVPLAICLGWFLLNSPCPAHIHPDSRRQEEHLGQGGICRHDARQFRHAPRPHISCK